MDEKTGFTTVAVDVDSGEERDLEHGLLSGSWLRERFSIHPDDPNSAKATAEWEQTGGREGSMWRTHVIAEMTSDVGAFHSNAILQAFLNDELFFEKRFSGSVPRKT